MRTRALIPWLSPRLYFKSLENSVGISHNKSHGKENEMHHPERSLQHYTQIKDSLMLS